jgi:hypothetical protein
MSVADEKWTVDAGGAVVDAPGIKIVAVAYAGSEQERETREREVARLVAMAPKMADLIRDSGSIADDGAWHGWWCRMQSDPSVPGCDPSCVNARHVLREGGIL